MQRTLHKRKCLLWETWHRVAGRASSQCGFLYVADREDKTEYQQGVPASTHAYHRLLAPASTWGSPLSRSPASASPFSSTGSTRSLSFWGKPPQPIQQQTQGLPQEDAFAPQPESPPQESSSRVELDHELAAGANHLPMPVYSEDGVAAIHEACNAVESAGLHAAKDDCFFAAGYFIDAIITLHQQAGLPWWSSIALANVLVRTLMLPVLITAQQSTSRMAIMNLDFVPVKKMQEAMAKVKTQEQQRILHAAMLEEVQRLKSQHGDSLLSTLMKVFGSMALNGFVFLSIFNGVSSLMTHKAPSLTQGGMLWFTDLTVPDPLYGLPVLCTLTTLAMIEYGINITGENMDVQKAGQAQRMKNVFRGMALLFLPFGGFVPSGVALLWVSNSFFSVVLGMALRRDTVRTAVGLPTMKDLAEVSRRMQDLTAADPLSFIPAAAREAAPSFSNQPVKPVPPPPGQSPSITAAPRGSNYEAQQVADRTIAQAQQQQPPQPQHAQEPQATQKDK